MSFCVSLQFPVSAHQQKSAENLGLSYVTERILASVLPRRATAAKSHHSEPNNGRPHNDESPASTAATQQQQPPDIYEKDLISMLEQKHGKVSLSKMHALCFQYYVAYLVHVCVVNKRVLVYILA